jgi:hypothetical protein
MIDPLNQLAFAMHARPGGYALLLGSGVSTGAGVPTGWAIVEDLVRRLAVLDGVEPPDVFKWFKERYGIDAEYSALLDRLCATPAERQSILRRYFEPSEKERERGNKIPGRAHRAIAELVASSVVRVIVTTNFDQLLETAIRDRGVALQIVSTGDMADGSVPLAHVPCTIIKVNGDYLDTRIRNTAGELETYGATLNRLVAQVFDEYGLLVCGWSADWDSGLRALLQAAPRRFSTFWWQRGTLSPTAEGVVAFREAIVMPINSADEAFERLASKIEALRTFNAVSPLSVALLVEELKQHLVDDSRRIRLADTVRREITALTEGMNRAPVDVSTQASVETIRNELGRLDGMSEAAVNVFATCFYWAREEQERLFVDSLRVVAQHSVRRISGSHYPHMVSLAAYPAVACFYVSGIAALARDNYRLLNTLFAMTVDTFSSGAPQFILSDQFIDREYVRALNTTERQYVPLSEFLLEKLRPAFSRLLTDSGTYKLCFNRFEYFAALQAASLTLPNAFGPSGRYAYLFRSSRDSSQNDFSLRRVANEQGASWAPLAAGLFGGTVESLQSSESTVLQWSRYTR